ncbi:MAG: molecular chaperone TorD family protein [Gammaproteobacteria bacterium]|jgi:DMSO reductase family type II enzyme chaperone|nr:molecular chaperone TorD family protein [Gammaproteobacteria bacterium]
MSSVAAGNTPGALRSVSNRNVAESAALRCLCYAAFSELLASPHEVDVRAGLRERTGLGETLDALLAEVGAAELKQLQAEYSGLFEVGSQGPPVPIREDLQTGQRSGTREDVVRFYDYFGYVLDEKFAWQPDHLSLQLEFMHYLCFRESEQAEEVLSYQLAQLDFAERHLVSWVPRFAAQVGQHAPGSLYARIVAALRDFIEEDFAWQKATVSSGDRQPA